MDENLFRVFVGASFYERFIGLARADFGGNVGAKVTHDIAPSLDLGRGPTASLAVQKVRSAALQFEERGIENGSRMTASST